MLLDNEYVPNGCAELRIIINLNGPTFRNNSTVERPTQVEHVLAQVLASAGLFYDGKVHTLYDSAGTACGVFTVIPAWENR